MSINSKKRRDQKRKRRKTKTLQNPGAARAQVHVKDNLKSPGVESYVQLSEATESRLSAKVIAEGFAKLHRSKAFRRLSEIAAALANSDDQRIEGWKFTDWALGLLSQAADPGHRAVAERLKASMRPRRTILHEKGIYLMQSLALTEGKDDGFEASDVDLAFLALAVNDYAADWFKSGESLSYQERHLADFGHFARFNRRLDPIPQIIRGELIMSQYVPSHPALNTASAWRAFQERVFGCTYSELIEKYLGPLAFQAGCWMTQTGEPPGEPPVIDKKKWAAEMQGGAAEGEAFLNTLCVSADTARSQLKKLPALQDVVRFPLPFYRTPLIQFRDDFVIAASPWLIEHQLIFGFWGKCLAAMKQPESGFNALTWFSVFGELFESYCRWVATEAEQQPNFLKRLYRFIPSRLGDQMRLKTWSSSEMPKWRSSAAKPASWLKRTCAAPIHVKT